MIEFMTEWTATAGGNPTAAQKLGSMAPRVKLPYISTERNQQSLITISEEVEVKTAADPAMCYMFERLTSHAAIYT